VRPLCVVDTNVVVSGLVSRADGAPPQRILNAMLAAELGFALSVELLAEYRGVLLSPRIMALHGLGEAEIDEILQRLALEAVEVDIGWAAETGAAHPVPIAVPAGVEPGDEHVARLALALPACVLITGDRALAAAMSGACEVRTAAEAQRLHAPAP
jgi:predicted nucleic acid-binding protein